MKRGERMDKGLEFVTNEINKLFVDRIREEQGKRKPIKEVEDES